MKTIATLLVALLIAGCASYDGRGLKPGVSSLDDVTQLMGEPEAEHYGAVRAVVHTSYGGNGARGDS